MKDLLVYCSNTETLVNKVREHYPDRLDVNVVFAPTRIWDEETSEWDEYEFPVDPQPPIMECNPRFLVDKTPTKRNGKNTLALVRCRDGVEEMLRDLASKTTTIKVLGTWEQVQADPKAKALYDEVYPRTPVTWVDEDGEEQESIPPEQIGVFA